MCIEPNIRKTLALSKGFTLIELIMVIVISGILATAVTGFITIPIRAYIDVVSRADLVEAAELSLRRMERDIRRAVPNSVRVITSGNVQALELVHTVDAFRYRAKPPGSANNILSFDVGGDAEFDMLQTIKTGSELLANTQYRLVINNRGELGANLYANADVITPAATTVTFANDLVNNVAHVTLNSPFQFTSQSPRQRVYVADTPVTYRCNPTSSGSDPNTIRRYWNYGIQSAQPIDPSSVALSSASDAILTKKVTACSFEYIASDPSQRNAIVNISLTIQDGSEKITLLHQVAVGNAP